MIGCDRVVFYTRKVGGNGRARESDGYGQPDSVAARQDGLWLHGGAFVGGFRTMNEVLLTLYISTGNLPDISGSTLFFVAF